MCRCEEAVKVPVISSVRPGSAPRPHSCLKYLPKKASGWLPDLKPKAPKLLPLNWEEQRPRDTWGNPHFSGWGRSMRPARPENISVKMFRCSFLGWYSGSWWRLSNKTLPIKLLLKVSDAWWFGGIKSLNLPLHIFKWSHRKPQKSQT